MSADAARDEVIAALDARTTRHGDQLEALEGTVSESAGLLAQVLPRVDGLAASVAELSGRIGAAGGGDQSDSPVLGVRWEVLTADEAVTAWNELGEWVATVLVPWYEITRGKLPDCWAMHRPVVRYLSTLHTAYLAAYTGPAASATAAADWHSRWLPNALAAIAAEDRSDRYGSGPWREVCAPGRHLGHHPDGTPALTAQGHPDTMEPTRAPHPHEDRDRPVPMVNDPAHHDHWGPFFQRAFADDVAARRAREASAQ